MLFIDRIAAISYFRYMWCDLENLYNLSVPQLLAQERLGICFYVFMPSPISPIKCRSYPKVGVKWV